MNARQAGFTILETILVIVVGAILAALLASIMGTSLTQSSTAINRQRDDFLLEQALAQVTRDYVSLTNNEPTRATALAVLKSNVDAGNYTQSGLVTVTAAFVAYDASGGESPDSTGADTTLKVTAAWTGGRTMAVLYTASRPDPTTQLVWY